MNYLKSLLCGAAILLSTALASAASFGQRENFNKDWLFTLSDSNDYGMEIYRPEGWRTLNLPHDWSVEHPFNKDGNGCVGYLPGGIGWYSKEFKTTKERNEKTFIVFDGIYNNAQIWINGRVVGTHYYGYSPFVYDLTKYLNPKGQNNRISVRVDRSRVADCRWYPGSGIYRDVEIVTTQRLYIPVWGTFVKTPVATKESADISIDVEVVNEHETAQKGSVVTRYYDPSGEFVKTVSTPFEIAADSKMSVTQYTQIENPKLWDTENPNIYTSKSEIISAMGETICTVDSEFGIRTARFDADQGFLLNGVSTKIKGVCIHHDGGLVGAAVPDDVWIRRFKILKEGGCNAIRTAHNPASERFLKLCDQMGFLVQEEFFDEWDLPKDKRYNQWERQIDYITRGYAEHFQEHAETDLKDVMKRSRNHPSIIQWSIGNEIEWTYPTNKEITGFFGDNKKPVKGGYFWAETPYTPAEIAKLWAEQPEQTYAIGETAARLSKWTREMDDTRAITANCILPSASFQTGLTDALDVVGFSYRRRMFDYAKRHYPDKCVMGTENHGHWHEWKAVLDRDFVSGMFIWCGFDFMGERGGNRKAWPEKQSVKGLLNLASYPRGSYFMFKALWNDEPSIALYTQTEAKSIFKKDENGKAVEKKPGKWKETTWLWQDVTEHWNYNAGEAIIAEAYSNCPEAELFINGKSLGRQYLKDQEDHIYKWALPFAEGTLMVRGYDKSGVKVEDKRITCAEPAKIVLSADRATMSPNEDDVVHVFVELVDAKGNPVRQNDKRVNFEISGDYRLLGVDNGAPGNVNTFQTKSVETDAGRCLLMLQSTDKASTLEITATIDGVDNSKSNKVTVKVK
ncbi:MAG: glycoside hydrolase family 2 TIM barrel-domain containing protein [Rikenellaceae bacterium]